MSIRLSQTAHAQAFLEEASGNHNDGGNPRAKHGPLKASSPTLPTDRIRL